MNIIASALVDWSSLWKIVIACLICGSGLVLAFSCVLIGVSRGREANSAGGVRAAGYTLATVAGAFCIAAVAFGLDAMIDKT